MSAGRGQLMPPGKADSTVRIVDDAGQADMTVAVVGDQVVALTGAQPGQVLVVQADGRLGLSDVDGGTP